MIFSFTGVQNSGKSTLLKALQEKVKTGIYSKFKWNFVPEITRKIAVEQGADINTKGANDEFQKLIMEEHIQNIKNAQEDPDTIHVLDRCIIDGALFTKYFYQAGKCSQRLAEWAWHEMDKNIVEYKNIFFCDYDIPLEDDGVRENGEFREGMIKIYNDFLAEHYWDTNRTPATDIIIAIYGTVEERMNRIEDILKLAVDNC